MNHTLHVVRYVPFQPSEEEPEYVPFEYTLIDVGTDVGTPVVRIGDQVVRAESFLAVADAVKRFYDTHPLNLGK